MSDVVRIQSRLMMDLLKGKSCTWFQRQSFCYIVEPLFNNHTGVDSVAYVGFWKGGRARNFKKFEKNKDQKFRIRNCSTPIPSNFLPEIRWRAKRKKKGPHPNLVRFFGQSWVQAYSKRIKHILCVIQARSQKFAMGELFWGFGGKAPSRRKLCVWGQSP